MNFIRYAIYWSPPRGSGLETFERRWFLNTSEEEQLASLAEKFALEPGLIRRATESPRRYGLHATIKAPFRLVAGASEAALSEAVAAFCSRRRRIRTGPLRLHRFARYLALVPESRRAELEWLADQCVTQFDRFRAPLDEADRARRATSLSPAEQTHFEQFGYPHIFSVFFFHITLAGPLGQEDLDRVEKALGPVVSPLCENDFIVDGLSLYGDPGGGAPFECVARYPLMR